MANEIPLEGNINNLSIPSILTTLFKQKRTGTLKISKESFAKNLYIQSGQVIFASSSYNDDRLGEILLKTGKINLQQYDKSVELLKETGKRQGTILVELGYLSPVDLTWGVRYQVKEIVYSLFQLEDAAYEFIPDAVPPDEVITLNMSLGRIISEGIRRIDNWTMIQRDMPPMDSIPEFDVDPKKALRELPLDEIDEDFLSLADGHRTMRDILNDTSLSSFEALRILYILYALGILVIAHRGEEQPMSATADEQEETDTLMAEFINEVNSLYDKLGSSHFFEFLGIQGDTDSESLTKRYHELARKFHPDRYTISDRDEMKHKLAAIFDAITNVYTDLKEGVSLEEIFSEQSSSSSETESTEQQKEDQASEQFNRGIREYKDGNYWQAAESFQWTTRLDGAKSKYWNYLSLSLSKIPGRLKQAEEALFEAIKIDPFNDQYYANLGLIYFKAGLKKRAKAQFEKALKLSPNNKRALEGIQNLNNVD
jgi:tetratricopeptide (TPR) repeat protein